MRKLLPLLILLAFHLPALAQSQARPVPKGSTPLEEPPPPPQVKEDPEMEPKVTTRKDGENTVEEFRVKGKLYRMKVTPKVGKPYWLVDEKGEGKFVRYDGPDLKATPPMWVILEWK